jgi:hypothetical protein
MAVLLVMAVLTGCGGVEVDVRGEGDRSRTAADSSTPNPESTAEALRFGELTLPPSAEVVWVGSERGLDRLYLLVIELDPGEVDQLLADSGFTVALQEQQPVHLVAPPGYDLDRIEDFASAQDRLDPTDDHPEVFRQVLIDRDNPDRTRVFWWLFTT